MAIIHRVSPVLPENRIPTRPGEILIEDAKRSCASTGYPPDKQEKATQTVLEQPEVPSVAWPA